MKNIFTYFSLLSIILFSSCSISSNVSQSNYSNESQDITYQQFYDDLSPYGQWIDYQNYGYVWMPAEQGFRPYYNNGQWVYTDYGWTWASNYNWGWAPFHYGRWLYDNSYGWMWVPGYEWAPAWVAWRSGGDYYGWAPLGPGMNMHSNYGGGIPYNNWAFVPQRYVTSPRINNYYVNRERNVTIINNTTIINNNTRVVNNTNIYTSGPSQNDFERNTHEKIRRVKIVQRNTPGDTKVGNSTVSIYRPAVKEKPAQGEPFRPRKVDNLNDVRERQFRGDGNTNNNNRPNNDRNNPELNPVDKVVPAPGTGNNDNVSPAPQKQTQPVRNFNPQKPVISNENTNPLNKPADNRIPNDTRQNDTRTQQPVNNKPSQNNNQPQPNSNPPQVEPNRRTFPNQNSNNQQQPAPAQNNNQQNVQSNKRTFPNQNNNNQQQPPVRSNIPPAANPPAPRQQNNNFQKRQNNSRPLQNNTQPNQKFNQPATRPQARPSTIMKNQNQERQEEIKRDNPDPKEEK